ncbi:ABC transporter ATP-binding protein [bacterium (Candidatus Blackallbacteria) CG17_big_fil_post_rev_8_21_14_2_50_48_46]|uniref:ABC transporter ATP-binding protein n=1 Tax=bacterium (Candidatus Blackallbacteria) CG17_big_fil_post_rev_8_21_14_2_50_48_46 TaxID=2014261 RepID=A0A2M7FXE0_9BACT|nr:MAG: ABC transporter ATP-binding protein [bacterium (Candidatus Blackallbacteria) CG18_big_fil_WC_8_21_14_2_50_49_26]PIW13779.1 MAG: ABC transporter ATP-binding protein [bacterium (Candidatus Blackallbacteria) CG17_big_fil_post_rev_8_21_14_2_50_48_46]PIW45005.1 MAG: ABC transporter ATP-binding protein [bacterium (Candidatus Blackallbacteria) CG13_big_fil_rev_8_21_14_2_50_49_14]
MASEYVIAAKGLEKAYGRQKALKSLDMQVPEGCVYGLLGRNGAGKTSTLRILMNLIRPTGGEVAVLGHRPEVLPLHLRQQMGYSSDSMQLIPWLRVDQILAYNGSFYPAWDAAYVQQWLKRLELDPLKRVFSLSRGDRQKLALILAIGHRPRLLILDEPAGGLDPLARQEFLESMIELIHESGTTIVISSHQMSDLERISDQIGLVVNGQMRLEKSLEALKAQSRRVTLLSKNLQVSDLKDFQGIVHSKAYAGYLELIHENWSANEEEKLLRRFPEVRIEHSPLSLEEIFIIYTSTLTAGGALCPATP